jgi:hypothetical protein
MVPRATLGSVRPRPNPFRNLQQEPPSRWVLYSVVNVRLLIARCILSFVGLHYLFNCQDNNIKCRWVRVMRGNEGSNKFPTLYCVFFKKFSIKSTKTQARSSRSHNSAWCSWFITFDCNSFIVIERSLVRFWERRYFLRL